MTDRDRHKDNIIELIRNVVSEMDKEDAEAKVVNISGTNNIVAGRDVTINKREIVRPAIKVGPEHISPRIAAQLQDLVRKAVEQDVASGDNERSAYAKWWSKLKKRFAVATYREIPDKLGEEAVRWMKIEIAKNRSKLRRTDKTTWRNELYKGIHARARELGMSKGELYALANDRLSKNITSLKQLGERNLKKLYNIIMAKKH